MQLDPMTLTQVCGSFYRPKRYIVVRHVARITVEQQHSVRCLEDFVLYQFHRHVGRNKRSFVEVLFNHVRILSGSLHRLPIHAEHTQVLLSKSRLQKRGILRISRRDDPSAFPFQSRALPKQKSHFQQPRKSNGRSSAAIFQESNLSVTRTFTKENV